jgi:hypothetical protein
VLALLPLILPILHLNLHPSAPRTSHGVTLMTAPTSPRAVTVPAPAKPVNPGAAPAFMTTFNATREAAMVAAEDKRLRTVLHSALRVYQPEMVTVRGSLPTLVLTAGQAPYTTQTLVEYGAMVMLPHNAALLIDNVYVSDNAELDLGSPNLRTLYLDSGSGGFATIVAWNGTLKFTGTAAHPLTIMGWDRSANAPATDQGYGRSYLREVGGKMTLTDVRATSLGFWSGRTGGVAWTGLTNKPSSGGATKTTFTSETYGAFVSRGMGVTFRDDLFEYNEVDGLHVHRFSVNTQAISSAAVRNGANGFSVSPSTAGTLFEDDISQHNTRDGFHINGRPLATGASAGGGSTAPGANTDVEYSSSLHNGKIGILVEGGLDTVVKGDQICGGSSGIEVKDGAANAVVTGNTISCSPRSGIELGPATPDAVLSGNAINGARTGILIASSGTVQLDRNLITNATVFGVSARGASSSVNGVGNTFAGTGFRAIDSRADAPPPSLYASNVANWAHRTRVTFLTYMQFHPLAALWLGIAMLLLLAWMWPKGRAPWHPYPHTTRWHAGLAPAPDAFAPPAAYQIPDADLEAPEPAYELPEPVGVGYREPSLAADVQPDYGYEADETDETEEQPLPAWEPAAWQRPVGTWQHNGGVSRPPWDTMPMPKLGRDS